MGVGGNLATRDPKFQGAQKKGFRKWAGNGVPFEKFRIEWILG